MTYRQKYRPQGTFDHLIVLAGSNPLPNVISIDHLLRDGGVAHIIHTHESRSIADRLEALCRRMKVGVRLHLADRLESSSLTAAVDRIFDDSLVGETISLNYTGGTKAMAVHVSAAYEDACAAHGLEPHLSYLDAESQRIIVYPEHRSDGLPQRGYAGSRPSISFRDLTDLHGWTLEQRNSPPTNGTHVRVASALARLFAEGHGRTYGDWKKSWRENWNVAHRRNYSRKAIAELAVKRVTPFPEHPAFDTLRELTGIESCDRIRLDKLSTRINVFPDPGRTCRWLDGLWLETYASNVIQRVAERQKLHDVQRNVVVSPPSDRGPTVEIDVVAMRASQLFAFSCSTSSSRSELKSKLFEIHMRARQLGGDQACACLITAAREPDSLQAEARSLLRSNRLLVLGRHDLKPDLIETRLNQWILDQKGDAP